uniref:Double PHD fingers 2 n=1 Tax=Homo sapiens TaxID=9606 RepID=A0A994J3P2_HUMAN
MAAVVENVVKLYLRLQIFLGRIYRGADPEGKELQGSGPWPRPVAAIKNLQLDRSRSGQLSLKGHLALGSSTTKMPWSSATITMLASVLSAACACLSWTHRPE